MTAITKLHERFWQRMSESLGTTWTGKHGTEPTEAWAQMLNKFTPAVIKTALDRMKDKQKAWGGFAPSLPAFEQWLDEVAAQETREQRNHIEDYWRSSVAAAILTDGALLTPPLWPCKCSIRQVPESARAAIITEIESLTVKLCTLEQKTGDRKALITRARDESWRFVHRLQQQMLGGTNLTASR